MPAELQMVPGVCAAQAWSYAVIGVPDQGWQSTTMGDPASWGAQVPEAG
jgi:hypothetical protein